MYIEPFVETLKIVFPIDVQVLVPIAWGRYICLYEKKKLAISIYCAKVIYEPWYLIGVIGRGNPLGINCLAYLDSNKYGKSFAQYGAGSVPIGMPISGLNTTFPIVK